MQRASNGLLIPHDVFLSFVEFPGNESPVMHETS